jgi:spoIIIJ-associated protein
MENDEIQKTLAGLLEKMGIAVDSIEVVDAAGHTLFTVHTKDSGVIIGSGGETLHALNHLMKKIFETDREAEEKRFVIDVNGYHLKHIKSLEGQAKMLAERARTFKYDVEMSPMSPYDRLIVHASLQESPEIKTESQGEGKLRHIVIKYTGGTTPE